jgi:Dual specificity phosphatase, catalytic domain
MSGFRFRQGPSSAELRSRFGSGLAMTFRSMRFWNENFSDGERNVGMDMTWVTGRIAVGGGIWNADNMAAVAGAGITHIIDMQIEFDDTALAVPHGIEVLWNPIDDDFQPKPAAVFQRGVDFAIEALDQPGTKVFIHCAAGVHRAPMMALALLCALGWKVSDALRLIETRRPQADFADVYVQSVERFLPGYAASRK